MSDKGIFKYGLSPEFLNDNDVLFEPLCQGVLRNIEEVDSQTDVDSIWAHELHQFLEFMCDRPFYYGHYNKASVARDLIDKGALTTKGHKFVPMMVPRENGGTVVLVDQPMTTEEFLKETNLRVSMKTPKGAHSVMKRMKRLLAPHEVMAHGRIIEDHGDVIVVQLDDLIRQRRSWASGKTYAQRIRLATEIRIRRLKGTPLNDGMNLISQRMATILTGSESSVGEGFKITGMDMCGQYKGHCMVYPDLAYDAVLYDPKSEIRLVNGHFVIGFLGNLKPTRVFTDLQSILNFRYEHRLMDWAVAYLDEIAEKVQTTEGIAECLGMMDEIGKNSFDELTAEDSPVQASELNWIMSFLIRGGYDVAHTPALRRRVIQMLLKVIDVSGQRVRIPIPGAEAVRRYVNVDPRLFDREGNILAEKDGNEWKLIGAAKEIPCGVWMPKLDAHQEELSFYRQPNGCEEEIETMNVYGHGDEFLQQFGDSPFLFISPFDIQETMSKLGGGDLDDPVVVFNTMTDHFDSLGFLPEAQKKYKTEEKPTILNQIIELSQRWTRQAKFDESAIKRVIEDLAQTRITIGQVVNSVIVTQAMKHSGMIQEIPDPVLHLARSVERVVDSLKKSGESTSDIQVALDDYVEWLKQQGTVPAFLMKQNGRIPNRHANQPVKELLTGIPTMYDHLIQNIEKLKIAFRNRDVENSYLDVQIPDSIKDFTVSEESKVLAAQIRRYYAYHLQRKMSVLNVRAEELRMEGLSQSHIEDAQGVLRQQAYKEAYMATYARFVDHPQTGEAFIQLWKDIYSVGNEVKRTSDGRPYFSDGLLWGACTEQKLPIGTTLFTVKALLLSKGSDLALPRVDVSRWLTNMPDPPALPDQQRRRFVVVSPGTNPSDLAKLKGEAAVILPIPSLEETEGGLRYAINAQVVTVNGNKPIGFVSGRQLSGFYTSVGCSDFKKLNQEISKVTDFQTALKLATGSGFQVPKVILGNNPGSDRTLAFEL